MLLKGRNCKVSNHFNTLLDTRFQRRCRSAPGGSRCMVWRLSAKVLNYTVGRRGHSGWNRKITAFTVVSHRMQPCQGWGRGFESLRPLQSAPDQTLSAIFGTAEKPNCRRHSRDKLGGSKAERPADSLSNWRILSEAWGLAHLL